MATFTETFSRMRQDFDDAQAARDQLFRATREHVGNLAHGVQQQLAGFRSDMRHLRGQITEMAGQVRLKSARAAQRPEHRRRHFPQGIEAPQAAAEPLACCAPADDVPIGFAEGCRARWHQRPVRPQAVRRRRPSRCNTQPPTKIPSPGKEAASP